MIEVVYKEEKTETEHPEDQLSLPRNVRQIGSAAENYRIYVEDYVYTFLSGIAGRIREETAGRAAVLTGSIRWVQGNAYIFIKGAVLAEDMEASREHLDFSDAVWKKINEMKEAYFPEQDIVGWYFAPAQMEGETGEIFGKTHLRYFGIEKVLMLMEPAEHEEAFYRYDTGNMIKIEGYYIYYEKNSQMQSYMIDKKQEMEIPVTEETDDKAVKSFRRIIRSKNKEATEEKTEGKTSVFSYAATACLAIAVLAVGANFYGDYKGVRTGTGESRPASVSAVVTSEPNIGQKQILTPTRPAATERPEKTETVKMQENTGGKETEKTDDNGKDNVKMQSENNKTASEKTQESTADVYKEESDVRKAKRREQLNASEEKTEEKTQTATSGSARETYVIRPGDTIYQISIEKYGNMDKIQEICKLNGISEDEIIYPGQIIVLP